MTKSKAQAPTRIKPYPPTGECVHLRRILFPRTASPSKKNMNGLSDCSYFHFHLYLLRSQSATLVRRKCLITFELENLARVSFPRTVANLHAYVIQPLPPIEFLMIRTSQAKDFMKPLLNIYEVSLSNKELSRHTLLTVAKNI